MSPTVLTSIGLIVACLIVLWAALLIYRRYLVQKKATTVARHTWVPLQASTPFAQPPTPRDIDEQEEEPENDLHTRAQQNGHYSETKHPH